MLSQSYQRPHLGALGRDPMQASRQVLLHEAFVQLLQRVDVALIVGEEQDVIFELRDAYVPEVEVFSQVLQDFRFNPYLRLLKGNNLLEQCLTELGLDLWRQ